MQDPLHISKQYWGYGSFRPMQREIITSVLEGRHTLALLPTGGGKSLCYQLPAVMQDGCCLVISPLIALMQDQVARLKQREIPAVALHAGVHYQDVKRIMEGAMQGSYKLLYISPERLQSADFRRYLPALDISLIAIDEAHCISQWGHDFRPDYLKIADVRELFPKVPVLALTATATPAVVSDISTQLRLQPAIYRQSFSRKNIFYDIRYSENKHGDLVDAVEQMQDGSAIVYCRSRKQTVAVTNHLKQRGFSAEAYHAGMVKDARHAAQANWMAGDTQIMVATTAFGMGIDKSDVRLVIHFDLPETLEAYYQESGRAGRDAKPAKALLLHNQSDLSRLHEHMELQFPKADYLRHVYQCVVEYLQIPIGNEPDTYFDFDLQVFADRFDLQPLGASYALKLLEQDGLWTVTESIFRPAKIGFITDRQTLDAVMSRYPDLSPLITNLLRKYSGILTYPAKVSVSQLAAVFDTPVDVLTKQIAALQSLGVLEYIPQAQGAQMHFHHRRVDSKHLIINTKRIAALRERKADQIAAIERFVTVETACREWQLLDYFGERHSSVPCGHCDVCRGKATKSTSIVATDIIRHFAHIEQMTITQALALFERESQPEVLTMIRQLVDDGQLQLQGQILSRKG